MHMNYTTEGTCTEQEHAQYIVHENYSRYSQIGKLYSPDLSMSVYIKIMECISAQFGTVGASKQ